MKYSVIFTVIIALLFCFTPEAQSQIKNPLKIVKKEGENRTNRGIDKTIDKGYDKIEEGIGNLFKKKDKKDKDADAANASEAAGPGSGDEKGSSAGKKSDPVLNWAKYDFVPGDKIIFEDNLEGEMNGEFPSRWDLHNGNVEIAEFGGENVILFRVASEIVPFIKNPTQDYLPDIFTLEFDCYFFEDQNYQNYTIFFNDRKNQKGTGIDDVKTYWNQMSQGSFQGWYPDASKSSFCKTEGWYHVSLLFNKRSLKVYLNDTRLLNVPNISGNPQGITIFGSYSSKEGTNSMIKNIRFAEAGQKLYEKFLQDGKIISNGIRFDVNKATLRPESMGIINEITTLMKDHPEISFSVEGHTDSDGDDALNQTLSEQRAATVVSTMKKMGIDANRLTSKGWGENKPLDTNATPEGKANNRRVEFVKK
ncbi:MAG: OmpA family protein [Bacteroidales bacterium]|nr:OmpA family protein [Bacteroidales bacterium]MDT8374807.1 OmpA family protein [Bacteroidales bacterium]